MTGPTKNYTLRGYSEHDGLGEGQWVTIPGSAGIRKWIGELEMPQPKFIPRGTCIDCSEVIDRRAVRCRTHASIEKRRLGREHMRKVRAETRAA